MGSKLTIILWISFSCGSVYADAPHYVHKDVSNQLEFEDIYQVLGTKLSTVTAIAGPAGASGSSSLAVGTGTASNFTTKITSPTAAISFLGTDFNSLATNTTNFIKLANTNITPGSYTNTNLTVDAKGRLTAASNGSGATIGGSNTNVQFNNSGAFGGDGGFQYDNSVSSVTVNGQIGSFASSNSIIFIPDNGSGDPIFQVDDSNGTPDGGISFTENQTSLAKILDTLTGFSILVTTSGALNPTSRIIFPKNNQSMQFNGAGGNAYVEFNPIGNSTFSIPVVISTLTIRNKIIDSAGSSGTNGQVLTSDGSKDTWITPSAGGTSSGSNGAVQFSSNTSFGSDTTFSYSTSTKVLSVSSITASSVNTSTLTVTSSMTVLSTMRVAGAATMNSTLVVGGNATMNSSLGVTLSINGSSSVNGKQLTASGSNIGGAMVDITDSQPTSSIAPVYSGIGIKFTPSDDSFLTHSQGYFAIKNSSNPSTKSWLTLGAGAINSASTTDYVLVDISTTGTTQGNTQVNGSLAVVTLSTQSSIIGNGLIVVGHIVVSSATPVLSSCGSLPTISGNDQWGKITVGSGVIGTCTMTFAVPWVNAPSCSVLSGTTIASLAGTTTTTAFTFTGTSLTSDVVMYQCGSYQ